MAPRNIVRTDRPVEKGPPPYLKRFVPLQAIEERAQRLVLFEDVRVDRVVPEPLLEIVEIDGVVVEPGVDKEQVGARMIRQIERQKRTCLILVAGNKDRPSLLPH